MVLDVVLQTEIDQPESPRTIAGELAKTLHERKGGALARIRRIAREMGHEWCEERVKDALEAHESGTCLRLDGKPRTLGGCFFHLAFEAMPLEQRVKIYGRANQGSSARPVSKETVVTEWGAVLNALGELWLSHADGLNEASLFS